MNKFMTFLGALTMHVISDVHASQDSLLNNTEITVKENSTVLAVLLHGYTLDGDSLHNVEKTLHQTDGFHQADILKPDMPLSTFSMATSSRITAELLAAIDKAWERRAEMGSPYERVVMVGHSIGGLYARKVYVAACGENAEAPFEQPLKDELALLDAASLDKPRPWAGAVDCIVLLAGMNRGWSISHHMSISRAVTMRLGVAAGYILNWWYGRPPVIFSIRRGSPFITQLRLQWLAMREHVGHIQDKEVGAAVTVQLLGTIDDLVSPDDNIDLVSGKDFVYLEVPESGHRSVINMDDSSTGKERQAVLEKAFQPNIDDTIKVHPADSFISVRRDVTDVVFVIHGIRDQGYWTRKIGRRVQQAGKEFDTTRIIATETSSYGYFPMLSFLRPGARQGKVSWLMDRYTEARARYPEAKFHFVAHSHGTYLLAKALQDYPSVQFEQVVFAGSVVRYNYQWQEFIPKQVKSVLNFVATADWVVAFFPKALQSIGIQDMGSAGHDGFKVAKNLSQVIEPDTYIIGGHSAALQEAMWDSIAKFTVTGEFQPPPQALRSQEQAYWVAYPAKIAPLIWVVIALLLGWGLLGLFSLEVREWVKTVFIMVYLAIIWVVLTAV